MLEAAGNHGHVRDIAMAVDDETITRPVEEIAGLVQEVDLQIQLEHHPSSQLDKRLLVVDDGDEPISRYGRWM